MSDARIWPQKGILIFTLFNGCCFKPKPEQSLTLPPPAEEEEKDSERVDEAGGMVQNMFDEMASDVEELRIEGWRLYTNARA